MKCMKKLVAVLLTAVMAMSLLTACGGGGASNGIVDKGDDFTKMINTKLKNASVVSQVEYDKTLNQKTETFYRAYTKALEGITNPTAEQKKQARRAGWNAIGDDGNEYSIMWYSVNNPNSYSFDEASTSFANFIVEDERYGYISKKIGYMTVVNEQRQPIAIWALVMHVNK